MEKSVESAEMNSFHAALRQVMHVSKSDLTKIIAIEKAAKSDKPRRDPKTKLNPGR